MKCCFILVVLHLPRAIIHVRIRTIISTFFATQSVRIVPRKLNLLVLKEEDHYK